MAMALLLLAAPLALHQPALPKPRAGVLVATVPPPLRQPPLSALLPLLRAEGFAASQSHSEAKALKTSATLDDVVRVVREYQRQRDAEEETRQEELEVEST